MHTQDASKSSTGIQANIAALLSYVLGFVSGFVFYMIERESKLVRFHAMQSMMTFGGLFVISMIIPFIPIIGAILLPVLVIGQIILWILLMFKAYQSAYFKLPIIGDIADKKA